METAERFAGFEIVLYCVAPGRSSSHHVFLGRAARQYFHSARRLHILVSFSTSMFYDRVALPSGVGLGLVSPHALYGKRKSVSNKTPVPNTVLVPNSPTAEGPIGPFLRRSVVRSSSASLPLQEENALPG